MYMIFIFGAQSIQTGPTLGHFEPQGSTCSQVSRVATAQSKWRSHRHLALILLRATGFHHPATGSKDPNVEVYVPTSILTMVFGGCTIILVATWTLWPPDVFGCLDPLGQAFRQATAPQRGTKQQDLYRRPLGFISGSWVCP